MVLEFKNVTKKYGAKYALRGFTATLTNGVYGLLGPNGAGKTTLINIVTGIMPPTAGDVLCDGVSTQKLKLGFISKVGYLPQHPVFYKDFRAREFMHYMCAVKDIPKNEAKKRTEELLEVVNLSDEAEKKIGAYSGGMRQRLGIAQAMLNDPELLILDEPTAGLDPKERIRFRNIISKLSADRIVILATHIVSDVEYIANEVILLKKGELLRCEKPSELLKTVEGRVYGVTVNEADIGRVMDTYNVGNIHVSDGLYDVRVICSDGKDAPDGSAPLEPNLEDVFLYYFREEAV
jgi:ABC-2 type transport system ATP-binding protein